MPGAEVRLRMRSSSTCAGVPTSERTELRISVALFERIANMVPSAEAVRAVDRVKASGEFADHEATGLPGELL
jgi:hypothetical protein